MKMWTSTKFIGHWPVGCAAVIMAHDVDEACSLLDASLKARGLSQNITPEMLELIPASSARAYVLCDGNY